MCAEGKTTRLLKQNTVKDFLDANHVNYQSYDKILDNGECNKLRPDFVIDCLTHCIIVEVDENQHKSVSYGCEVSRMINIHGAIGLDTLFIRYNPDKYKGSKNVTEKDRLDALLRWIQHYSIHSNLNGHHLSTIKLFYDGNNQEIQSITYIDP
jgi:hypothetical protein